MSAWIYKPWYLFYLFPINILASHIENNHAQYLQLITKTNYEKEGNTFYFDNYFIHHNSSFKRLMFEHKFTRK